MPQSMVARTIFVLVAAIVLSNLIVFGWHIKERHDVEAQAVISRVVERMTFPVGVLAGADQQARVEIAPTLQGRFRRVWLTDEPLKAGFAPPFGVVADFRKVLEAEMASLGVTEVHFGLFKADNVPQFERGRGFGRGGMHGMHHDERPRDGLGPRWSGWEPPNTSLSYPPGWRPANGSMWQRRSNPFLWGGTHVLRSDSSFLCLSFSP